eukprot:gene30063-37535_t
MLEEDAKLTGATLHFVEDKISTLEKVCTVSALDHWNLYL